MELKTFAVAKFEQRRVSLRLQADEWAWFDANVKYGAEPDDRAVSWALRQYIARERRCQALHTRRSLPITEGVIDGLD